ncbi:helix-turn-helix domain-containing protein [Pseudovibrio brasiliensis]|uniref:Helix-turn-helix domain-containing protein n=2 Tax=Pseudovibrio brasiliensis TaxID=1898042 RepID=A0ABX8AZG5_9HYPH|nr:helix-turn-helix domain-containing protein [Pseudovibrio brasiliensis]QUS59076.1 helix-turn-helix domain-containing protein [Pseudovibrio brasiliensis]
MKIDPDIIDRTARVTRKKLGYTPSEIKEVVETLLPTVADRHELRTALEEYEKTAQYRPMTGELIREARKKCFFFTAEQFGPLLGFKDSGSIRSTMSNLENGRTEVTEMVSRLARAYLAGHRPPDWPKNPKLKKPSVLDKKSSSIGAFF